VTLRRRGYLVESSGCPLRDITYGGIKTGGGFNATKELEVGAQRMAEAAHCILGSLGRHLGSNRSDWDVMVRLETGHLREEMGLIEKFLDEYARDIYINQINGGWRDYKPEYQESSRKYIEMFRKSVLKNAPKLIISAKENATKLFKNKSGIPMVVFNAAISSYLVLVRLAESMLREVKKMPGDIGNPFKDYELIFAVRKLRKYVDQVISGNLGEVIK